MRRSTRNKDEPDLSETPKIKKSQYNKAHYDNNVNKMKKQYNYYRRNGKHDEDTKVQFNTWLAHKNFPDEDVKKFKSDLKAKSGFNFEPSNER